MPGVGKIREVLVDIETILGQDRTTYIKTAQSVNIDIEPFITTIEKVHVHAFIMGQDLMDVFTHWHNVQNAPSDEICEIFIRNFVISIEEASTETALFQSQASNLSVQENDLIGQLNSAVKKIDNEIEDNQNRINNLKIMINANAKAINNINSQLSGSSGFWQGFLTGITVGIYPGLRNKLSDQKKLRREYNSELAQLKAATAYQKTESNQLKQVCALLQTISCLYADTVSLENSLNSLSQIAQQTEHDGERITSTDNVTVKRYFIDRCTQDMNVLNEWQNVFN